VAPCSARFFVVRQGRFAAGSIRFRSATAPTNAARSSRTAKTRARRSR
jgi:hypothetical protein